MQCHIRLSVLPDLGSSLAIHSMPLTRHNRSAFSLTEVMVCASLVLAVMSFIASITLRTNRMWRDTRHQRIGLDELSNQMERLTLLELEELKRVLPDLEPSPMIQNLIPTVSIEGKVDERDDSVQIILTLAMDKEGDAVKQSHPLTLVGFLSSSQGDQP